MKQRTWGLVGFLLSLMVISTAVVVRHLGRTSPTVARKLENPLPVRVVAARQINLTEVLGSQGEVEPIALVNLTAKITERVEKVAVDLGDMVSRGQVLIHFDRDLLNAALITAQATVQQGAGERDRAVRYLRRIKAMHEQSLVPRIEVEKAQAVLEEAEVRYSNAQEKLLRARKDLKDATIVSPVSGIVMERLINPAETPRSNQKLLTIGRIDQVLVRAKIAEERVGDVHLQQSATVTFNAFPNDEVEGKVVKIKPVTDPKTRTFFVYVKVVNPDRKFKPGLTAFVRIKSKHRVIAVPSVSMINPTGLQESSVFVVENGSIARLNKVKVGVVAEGMTEILDGLLEGDQVVVVGQFHLRDGDQVRIGDEFNEIKPKFADGLYPKSSLAAER